MRELRFVLLLHSANVRVNEVRLLSLGALRHHSSDCLRQRPSVGGYSSQFARTLLRLCFAKLLVLLVGGPDDATACAPYGARPVASGNLTTSSQVHLVAGASRAHPTRRLWRGRISWRCGDWEFGRRSSKSPKLQVAQQRKQQKAFVGRTSGTIELQEGFGRWCAGMVLKWVRELANARTHSWSECGDGHDMVSAGAGVSGGGE